MMNELIDSGATTWKGLQSRAKVGDGKTIASI